MAGEKHFSAHKAHAGATEQHEVGLDYAKKPEAKKPVAAKKAEDKKGSAATPPKDEKKPEAKAPAKEDEPKA